MLTRRLAELLETTEVNDGLISKLDEYGVMNAGELGDRLDQPDKYGDKPIGELTDMLGEFDIEKLEDLRKLLELTAFA